MRISSNQFIRSNIIILVLSILATSFFGLFASPPSSQAQVPSLFFPVSSGGTHSARSNSQLRSRIVGVNTLYLQQRTAGPIPVTLFDGVTLFLIKTGQEAVDEDTTIWIGSVVGAPHSEVLFTMTDGIVAGTINTGETLYRIRYDQSISVDRRSTDHIPHLLEEMPDQFLPNGEPLQPTYLELDHDRTTIAEGRAAAAGEKIGIDLLFVYTEGAEAAFGGPIGTANTLDLAIAESNLGFENSRINVEFDLVHAHKVDLDEANYTFPQMLAAISSPIDGIADEIHGLRDLYGADVVVMLVDRPILCGISYQMNNTAFNYSEYAFNVVHADCATGYYSVAHEIGHNLGSQHDHAHASANGVFEHSHGFQDPGNRFRTIMAYNCSGGCARINHWSNPNVFFQTIGPTGMPLGAVNAAHNTLSIMETAPRVSRYRAAPIELNQSVTINFRADGLDIPYGADDPTNELVDTGEVYQSFANGFAYGWNHPVQILNSGAAEGGRAASQYAPEWRMALPNGRYRVSVTFTPSGDPAHTDANEKFFVEGNLWTEWDNPTETPTSVLEGVISVNDGMLEIGAKGDVLWLNQVVITAVEDATNLSLPYNPTFPAQPGITHVYAPLATRGD